MERRKKQKMGRAPCCNKEGLRKGAWTAEEDKILVAYITKNGHGNWRSLPKLAGLSCFSHTFVECDFPIPKV